MQHYFITLSKEHCYKYLPVNINIRGISCCNSMVLKWGVELKVQNCFFTSQLFLYIHIFNQNDFSMKYWIHFTGIDGLPIL